MSFTIISYCMYFDRLWDFHPKRAMNDLIQSGCCFAWCSKTIRGKLLWLSHEWSLSLTCFSLPWVPQQVKPECCGCSFSQGDTPGYQSVPDRDWTINLGSHGSTIQLGSHGTCRPGVFAASSWVCGSSMRGNSGSQWDWSRGPCLVGLVVGDCSRHHHWPRVG